MAEASKETFAENPVQGLTRRWRTGSQEIPWPVASPQSLPPLLLTVPFQKIAVSPCICWTSESCLEKSHRFAATPNSRPSRGGTSLKEMFVSRGSLGDFWYGVGVFGTVVERAVADRGDRLWIDESRREYGACLVVVGRTNGIGGRAIGSCDCELVAAFLSLCGGSLSRHPFVNTAGPKLGGSRSWRDTE